jgi:hypothetical protein
LAQRTLSHVRVESTELRCLSGQLRACKVGLSRGLLHAQGVSALTHASLVQGTSSQPPSSGKPICSSQPVMRASGAAALLLSPPSCCCCCCCCCVGSGAGMRQASAVPLCAASSALSCGTPGAEGGCDSRSARASPVAIRRRARVCWAQQLGVGSALRHYARRRADVHGAEVRCVVGQAAY